jgi:outer membrane lipoprotein-sorting protein
MKCFRRGAIIAIAGLFVVSLTRYSANAAELKTAPEILEFSSAKMGSYKTWSADYSQSLNLPGGEMTVTGRMTQKPPRKMWMQLDMPVMGQVGKMTMILGEDGILWQIMQVGPRPQIMKADMNKVASDTASVTGTNFNPLDQMDPSKQWEGSKKMYDFKVVAVREGDGHGVYVMEGLSKPGAVTNQQLAAEAAKTGKMRVSIGQSDGFVRRMELYDKSLTNRVTAMEFKNLKFNADIPDATFVYQPPAGAQIADITEMFENQVRARQGESAPAAPESAPSRSAPAVPKGE